MPSTVTLEFLKFNKPVLNIGFGPDGKFNNLLSQHFEAGFYRDIFKSNNLVHKAKNLNEFMKIVNTLLKTEILKKLIMLKKTFISH